MIDQVRGALRHAAAAAAWTDGAALTGKGDEAIEPTRAASKPREAARQPAALEKAPKGPLDKGGQSFAVAKLTRPHPKRFEMVSDDLV